MDLAGPVGRSGGMGCTEGELMRLVLEMRSLALRWTMGRVGGSAIGLSRGRCNCEAGSPLNRRGGTVQSTCNRHTSQLSHNREGGQKVLMVDNTVH